MNFVKLLFLMVICFLCLFNVPVSAHNEEHYYTDNFHVSYTDDFEKHPAHAVTLNQAADFAQILENVRSKYDGYGFHIPAENDVSVEDISGMPNAFGGTLGITVDPFFLGKFDELMNATSTSNERWGVALHEYMHVIQWHAPIKGTIHTEGNMPSDWVREGQCRVLQDKLYSGLDNSGDMFAGYFGECNSYLNNPNQPFFDASYSACLFWNYLMEQYGNIQTEPDVGVDVIQEFWDVAEDIRPSQEITVINKVLENLGHSSSNFYDIFGDFVVANYLKDIDGHTAKYGYQDETQPPGSYDPVKIRRNVTLGFSESCSGTDSANRLGSQYYVVKFEKEGSTVRPVKFQVKQITQNELMYRIITIDASGDIEVIKPANGIDLDWTLSLEPGSTVILIVTGKAGIDYFPAKYRYVINSLHSNTLEIQSPLSTPETLRARAGVHNAPQKIMATIEVLSNLEPITAISRNDFHCSIGGKTATVCSAFYAFGLYLLEILPPTQTSDGKYNITISYGSLTDTETEGIMYTNLAIDCVTVIDASGSMNRNNKSDAAKVAAQVFVNSALDDDLFGIVHFHSDADSPLGDVLEIGTRRNTLLWDIGNITSGGDTSVGDGIFLAQNLLFEKGDPLHPDYMIILSDGKENKPVEIAKVDQLLWSGSNSTICHSVIIGQDANAPALEAMTRKTGGLLLYAVDNTSARAISAAPYYPITSILTNYYRQLVEKTLNEQRVVSGEGYLGDTWTLSKNFSLEEAASASIVLSYHSDKALNFNNVKLVAPNGTKIAPTLSNQYEGLSGYYGHAIWKLVKNPAGTYTISVSGGSGFCEYFYDAAVRSPLTLNLHFPLPYENVELKQKYRVEGCEFPIVATLTATSPMLRATVYATVSRESSPGIEQSWRVKLYDDGRHGDGFANDGVYANNFTRTAWVGAYQVTVTATGTIPLGDTYSRETMGAFYLAEDYDSDADGLPNNWEQRHNLADNIATGDDGPLGDPDHDGINNSDELLNGIYPRRIDTDFGGESDPSELANNRDPWFAEDDNIAPPEIYGRPLNAAASIYFNNMTGYTAMNLYRTTDTAGNFSLIKSGIDPFVSPYNDTGLTNGVTYYYRMQAIGASGLESGYSNIAEVTPRLDVYRPEGYIIIAGTNITKTHNVQLYLWAESDVTQMKISQDASFESVSWQSFASKVAFTLAGDGLQMVYVVFKDSAGNIGGHDNNGLAAFDGIIVNHSYIPPPIHTLPDSHLTTPSSTSVDFCYVLMALPVIFMCNKNYKKKNL